MRSLLTVCLLASCVTAGGATMAGEWSARYACLENLTEEQKDKGWLPGWKVTFEDTERPVVRTEDNEPASCMGHVLLGCELEPLDPPPRQFYVVFEHQMSCSVARRAGSMTVRLLSKEAWDGLPTEPGTRVPLPRFGPGECLSTARYGPPGGEDVTEWSEWRSPNLAAGLVRTRGKPLVLTIGFTGFHASGREEARVRDVKIETNWKPPPPVVRERHYGLKTARTLHTEEELAQARANIEGFRSAKSLLDGIVAQAERWVAMSDDGLLDMIPPATVPRAFNVSIEGCPVHGKKIYEHGTYPWTIRPDKPYLIECPVGHETYPGNDFHAYLRSGHSDATALQGDYVDDGWGWVDPKGERRWFVGYACHWHWTKYVIPAVRALSRAYLLTGNPTFGHKGALMLAAIAADYPNFDYASQSRYGFLTQGRYHGKILNHIWETGTFQTLAEAYDNLWDHFDGDTDVQARLGKTGEEIRSMIEAQLLEEGIECTFSGKIQGNFGMHQLTLATAAVVRQHGPVEEWCRGILTCTDRGASHTGLNYALYNLVHRDGMPNETAPGYCFIWPSRIVAMAPVLRKAGIDLFQLPKMKSLVMAPLDLVCVGAFTPDVGDSGSVWGGIVGRSADVYQPAYHAYPDPRIFDWLREAGAVGEAGFRTYDSLFAPTIPRAESALPTPATRLMDGYGMALLCNERNTLGLSMYYGYRGGHSHFDTLGFDLYANGRKMMPDLGYPDFMNGFVSGIFTWSKNTISHNCVMIDRQRQTGNGPGRATVFAATGGVHAVEVSAPSAYPGCEDYRRGLVLVETGADTGYVVDVFRVAGGKEHHYSVHGPPGHAEVIGGTWTEPVPGTLAGKDVPVGLPYDDPVLGQPDYRGAFGGYRGSGFSHFVNVQHHEGGEWVAEYSHMRDERAKLHIRVLPAEGQEVMIADAQVSPVKHKELVKYVLARQGGPPGLSSLFVGVFEPFRDAPLIESVSHERLLDGILIEVRRGAELDRVLYRTAPESVLTAGADNTDGDIAVITRRDGKVVRAVLIGGRRLDANGVVVKHEPVTGTVAAVFPAERQAELAFGGPVQPGILLGKHLAFVHGERLVRHRVTGAEKQGGRIRVTLADDILIGRAKVASAKGDTISTPVAFTFPAVYPGCRAADESFGHFVEVVSVGSTIRLAQPFPEGVLADADEDGVTDIWLCSFGPGASVSLPSVTALLGQ